VFVLCTGITFFSSLTLCAFFFPSSFFGVFLFPARDSLLSLFAPFHPITHTQHPGVLKVTALKKTLPCFFPPPLVRFFSEFHPRHIFSSARPTQTFFYPSVDPGWWGVFFSPLHPSHPTALLPPQNQQPPNPLDRFFSKGR